MSPASGDILCPHYSPMKGQVSIQLMSPASGDFDDEGVGVLLDEFPFN